MKLLVIIVQDQDVHQLLEEFSDKGFNSTKLASTGGFLREGNTTLMVGVEDDKVEDLISIIKDTCRKRDQYTSSPTSPLSRSGILPKPTKIVVGGATIFMVDVERFEKI